MIKRPPPSALPGRRGSTLARHLLAAVLVSSALTGAQAATDAKASRYYEDALQRYERKDIPGAIIQLKNALQIDKRMLPVQVLLGKALLANGEAANAEIALTEALNLGVNRAEVVVPLAKAVAAQGKQKLLMEQPRFALAGLPPDVQLHLLLLRSSAASDLGDVQGAMKYIEDARAIDGRSIEAWLAEVPVRIRARQFREAHLAADKGLALGPNSPEAWYQKGSIAHVQNDLQAALSSYDKALRSDGEHVESRLARAGIYLDQGRTEEAKADIAEVRRVAPIEPRGAYLQALMAERGGDAPAARAALREVTELIDPIHIDFIRYRPQLLMLNGLAHFGLNEREKAKPYLELFQKVQNNSPVSKLLAQVYLGENNPDRAIEVLENYMKNHAGDAHGASLLAGAYMAKGRHAKATALMQEVLRSQDAPQFRTALGLSLIGGGQLGNAVVELETAFKKDPKQVQAGVALVSLYVRNGQARKAATVAQALVKQQPSNPSFHNLLGIARAQSGDAAGARTAFEQAVKLDGSLVQPQLGLARLDIGTKAYEAAAKRLAELLKADERNVDAMYDMAVLAERRGQPAEAQRWLDKAVDYSGPHETRPSFALVELHLRSGRPVPALEAAKRLLSKAPDAVPVLVVYARAQLANGDAAGARITLTNASRRADYEAAAQFGIASLQISANDVAGAAYSLEKALKSDADFLPAQALMSNVELRQGDPAKAERRARQIIQSHPKLAVGHHLLGEITLSRGQAAAALESFRRAHELEPSSASLLRLFAAMASQDAGKPTGTALQLANQWLKTHPKDLPVLKAVANTHAAAGNFVAARSAYEQLLKLAPDDADTLNNLANVLLRTKDPAALKVAEQALAKAPNNANVIDTAGWAAHLAGQNERALQLLRDARLRDPSNPDIRYHLAAALAQAGRKGEAREELNSALKTHPGFEHAAEANHLLQALR
ncbi:XrtA/PEP-CTERM system TPR-repeat protein PrsT [Roseateles toxinivorans]|uniref:Putative PEP-CTERM system TPR-repeat lipoprotein n=1 Tax=Roseateles toxinivorans TaxID=270368 RepID=A0A4R6QB81_9BURK|nr:XrtA/PEP-CTERM system TPR-repeat protein PrsT [Roseateles toxinivorans]TDP59053.1 putative PEP-CTERM system TPR-repeat lipoprotein [Roseateles toxinivorans]